MFESKKTKQAKSVLRTICQTLDDCELRYDKDEEKLLVTLTAKGDDLPVDLVFRVDADRQSVRLVSPLPFKVKEDRRLETAVAVNAVNDRLVDGCFDFDVNSGEMFFRMTNSYIESELGKELFVYMTFCTFKTVDEYNDKFMMLAKDLMSIEQFLSSLNK